MLRMNRLFPTAAALCSLVVSAYAANGVVISMKTTSGGSSKTTQIQLDANHMRAQMTGRSGNQNGVIFDGVKQSMIIIDDTKKTYSEITKDDLDRLAAQMQQSSRRCRARWRTCRPSNARESKP